jgi:hypothetical protein
MRYNRFAHTPRRTLNIIEAKGIEITTGLAALEIM